MKKFIHLVCICYLKSNFFVKRSVIIWIIGVFFFDWFFCWIAPLTSSPAEIQRYMGKISGPLLDRIDIHVEVTPVPFEKLTEERRGESSIIIRERVTKARQLQTQRFENLSAVHYNAQMQTKNIRNFCVLYEVSKSLLKQAMERLNLSARAYDRILKVARAIADLEASKSIESKHISEAIQYRSLDRVGWLG